MTDQREQILIVDDSPQTREILERNLSAEGYSVHAAKDVAAAVAILARTPIDLVVTDLRMPGADGLELVRHVRHHHRWTGVIMVTGYATVDGAVSAMREGVEDYLPKPFSDDELRQRVRSTLEKVRLRRELEAPGPAEAPDGIVGQSPAMQRVYRLVARAAETGVPVLITGESGTGKELVARGIHYRGPRARAPFLAVNCAAIPETLIESELFGHAKGAFTGATAPRQGFFVAADAGTLFLDEVAELSPIAQAKLLRVLQEQYVQAVGADTPRRVDVRIIAATNKDLDAWVRQGRFREDLFFRLHVLPIEIPPLRERGEDIVLLVRHFLAAAAAAQGSEAPRITDAAMEALLRYSWPGNVRELQNLVQRLVILAEGGVIDVVDLPSIMRSAAPGVLRSPADARPLREVELEHIRAVLDSVGGNKTKAAAILGIDRKSLREKLKNAPPESTPPENAPPGGDEA